MRKVVKVPLPLNLDKRARPLFEPYTSYEVSSLKVKKLKNVLVTYSGLAVGHNGLIRECHHDYPSERENCLHEASNYYHDAKDKPEENLIVLDNQNYYLLIHHPWYNYYHWMCEAILRLWIVRNIKDNMILLLPDYYGKTDFIMGSLEPFNLKNIYFIPSKKSVLIRNLCLPQIKPICDSYHVDKLNQIRNFYLDYFQQSKNRPIHLGERLYISRKKASRKKVVNELDVEKILAKYDFNIIDNEDYSFMEQVGIYSNARYLISIHGSGLTNMLFMKDRSSVLEIHKKKTNTLDRPSFVFWYQAAALGFKYYHQMSDPLTANDDYFWGDFKIDLELFEENIVEIISNDK